MMRLWFVVVMTYFVASPDALAQVNSDFGDEFLQKLIEKYGSDGTLSLAQLRTLMNNARGVHETHHAETDCITGENATCEKCLGPEGILKHHSVPSDGAVNSSQLWQMSPTIIYELQNPGCHGTDVGDHHGRHGNQPSHLEVWGYAFLCVTLINLCALMGLFFLPLMKKSFYSRLLMYMVALAVGTLAGSSILFLIPEAFALTESDHPLSEDYVWKSTTVLGGIYLFFLVERLLKIIMNFRMKSRQKDCADIPETENCINGHVASIKTHDPHVEESMNMSFKAPPPGASLHESHSSHGLMSTTPDVTIQAGKVIDKTTKPVIKPVAWMVIFGDGLHNFIDGLSIGAAFSESLLAGISVSVAVICEELPHELGDFAILLNSGMSMRKALCYNFLSACMCYLGLIIGIMVGELSEGSYWIFALAGGMFLYISLVDMLPEVNHAADEEKRETGQIWRPFLLQNAGILTGYGLMIILAYFGGQIDFSS